MQRCPRCNAGVNGPDLGAFVTTVRCTGCGAKLRMNRGWLVLLTLTPVPLAVFVGLSALMVLNWAAALVAVGLVGIASVVVWTRAPLELSPRQPKIDDTR